jgi:hypothetical protein
LPLIWGLFAAAPAAQATALPPDAFGALPEVSGVVISPDGNLLAWEERLRRLSSYSI